jgi:hypothetical protein
MRSEQNQEITGKKEWGKERKKRTLPPHSPRPTRRARAQALRARRATG